MSLSEDQIAKARMNGMLQKEDIADKVKKLLKKRSSVALSALQRSSHN